MALPGFQRHRVRQVLTLIIMVGVLLCIFPYPAEPFIWWSKQALWITPAFLALGLIFAFSNRSRLMVVCLGSSAAIAFNQYVKSESNNRMKNNALVRVLDVDARKIDSLNADSTAFMGAPTEILHLRNIPDANFPVGLWKKNYPFHAWINKPNGGWDCILTTRPMFKPDTFLFYGVNAVAFQLPIQKGGDAHAWIITPIPDDVGRAAARPSSAPALRQPFLFLGNPDSDNLKPFMRMPGMEDCVSGSAAEMGSANILHSNHFQCVEQRAVEDAGVYFAFILPSYYVYID